MTESFSTTCTVASAPEEVSAAISKPQVWWNQLIQGRTEAVGDEFGFAMPGVHSTRMRVTEAEPGRRIVWHVLENHFGFVQNQEEWVGTDVVYDIEPVDGGSRVTLTHVGLVPEHECYEVCSTEWTRFLDVGLRAMLVSGNPAPMTAERAAEIAEEFAAAR